MTKVKTKSHKTLRVLLLMHGDLVPPDDWRQRPAEEVEVYKTERDVYEKLRGLGHEVLRLGILDELQPLRQAIIAFKPDVAFNLLEEFSGQVVYDAHVVGYLELMNLAYTGCNPRGLVLSRDKGLGKKILMYHRVPVPDFAVFQMGRKPKRPKKLAFPLIVKSLVEEASLGISQASVVDSDEKFLERVAFIHERLKTDAIVESFIPGRELYVGVLGNDRLQVLPPWELMQVNSPDAPLIATRKAKWDLEYQKKHGIISCEAKNLTPQMEEHIKRVSKRIYRTLGLSGYARLDYRLDPQGRLFFLEANPNPQIAADEDFALSAKAAGMSYGDLIQKLLLIGMQRKQAGPA